MNTNDTLIWAHLQIVVLGTTRPRLPWQWWRIPFAGMSGRGADDAERLRLVTLDAADPEAFGKNMQPI
jgi:hypothetical protein